MKINVQLITHILDTSGKSPEQIANGLAFYESIENTISLAKIERQKAKTVFDEKAKALHETVKKAQERCDHPTCLVSHHNAYEDKYSECGVCGKTW